MKTAARASLWLVVAIAVGCGSSLKNDQDGNGSGATSTGGGAGEGGGSGATSGSGGGVSRGGSAQSGSSGSGGSSAQGGSAQGGSTDGGSIQGGSSGAGGEGGDSSIPTRLFLQMGNALVANDPETADMTELCPGATATVRFDFIDWVNERAIFQRRTITAPSATEILRVALDGSECTSLIQSETALLALSPAAGDRVVLAITPVLMSALEPPGGDHAAIRIPLGLASLPLDGSPLDVITPNGVFEPPLIVGEHVLFQRALEAGGYEFFSALSDGSSVIAPVPVAGLKQIAASRGRRVVVNTSATGDVYAVDADGGNLTSLATAPEPEVGAGFVGNRVVITRYMGVLDATQTDLLIVDESGGELTPLATSADAEFFRGSAGERVIYERASDLHSVRHDGSDARPIMETPGVLETFLASVGDRIVFGTLGESGIVSLFNAAADGSDIVTLHESASGFVAVAGERVVMYVGVENYDLVSVPMTGGDPWLLSDSAEPDWLVGKIGTMLVIQRGDRESQGAVLRIDADGSNGASISSSARYVGSVSEACGAARAGLPFPPCSE